MTWYDRDGNLHTGKPPRDADFQRSTPPTFTCDYCKVEFENKSHSRRIVYCSRKCAGLGRRTETSKRARALMHQANSERYSVERAKRKAEDERQARERAEEASEDRRQRLIDAQRRRFQSEHLSRIKMCLTDWCHDELGNLSRVLYRES